MVSLAPPFCWVTLSLWANCAGFADPLCRSSVMSSSSSNSSNVQYLQIYATVTISSLRKHVSMLTLASVPCLLRSPEPRKGGQSREEGEGSNLLHFHCPHADTVILMWTLGYFYQHASFILLSLGSTCCHGNRNGNDGAQGRLVFWDVPGIDLITPIHRLIIIQHTCVFTPSLCEETININEKTHRFHPLRKCLLHCSRYRGGQIRRDVKQLQQQLL